MNDRLNAQVIIISAGKIFAMLATFIVPVLLTRYLTKDEYGIYGQFNTILLFCSGFFSMGVTSNLYFFYPRLDDSMRRIIVFQTFLLLTLFSLFAILALLLPGINTFFLGNNEVGKYLYFLIGTIFFVMASGITEPLYILRRDNLMGLIYPLFTVLLKAIVVVVFIFYFTTIESVFYAIAIVSFFLYVFSIIYLRTELHVKEGYKLIDLKLLKQQLIYSLPFGISVSLNTILGRLDRLLLISYVTTSQYASYTVAFLSIPGIQAIYDSLVQVYITEMSVAHNQKDHQRIISIYHDLLIKSFSYTLPAIVIVFYYAELIIKTLFTSKYIDSVPLFRFYILGTIFMVIGAGVVLRATGKTRLTLRSYIKSSLISIPATYFLVVNYGLWGAMVSALIGMVVPKLFLLHYDMKILETTIFKFFPWFKIFRIFIISISFLIVVIVIDHLTEDSILNVSFISILFLISVFMIEIKYNLFIIEKEVVLSKLNKIKDGLKLK